MRWLGYFFIFMGIKMATDGVPRFGIAFVWLAVLAGWFANFLISYVALNGCKVFSP